MSEGVEMGQGKPQERTQKDLRMQGPQTPAQPSPGGDGL